MIHLQYKNIFKIKINFFDFKKKYLPIPHRYLLSLKIIIKKIIKVHEGNPAPSYAIVSQLIWREFFYAMSTNNPFYGEIERNPICINVPWYEDQKVSPETNIPITKLIGKKITKPIRFFQLLLGGKKLTTSPFAPQILF